jgi:hypothetical protein
MLPEPQPLLQGATRVHRGVIGLRGGGKGADCGNHIATELWNDPSQI